MEDPYSFGPLLGNIDLHLFSEGTHYQLAERFGAIVTSIEGIAGVQFSVWAPNAKRVSVVGNFNLWDGRRHPMRLRHSAGIWEIFIPRLSGGERYKYEIVGPSGDVLPLKADPMARGTERPPATASVVQHPMRFHWKTPTGRGRAATARRHRLPCQSTKSTRHRGCVRQMTLLERSIGSNSQNVSFLM